MSKNLTLCPYHLFHKNSFFEPPFDVAKAIKSILQYLNWVGFEKCKYEIENHPIDKILFTLEEKTIFNFTDEKLNTNTIYTKDYKIVNIDNKKEQPFELIIPSFSNWMCDSLTFNIISTYTYDLYCKTQRVMWPEPEIFRKFNVDEVDDKFWVFLSSLGIKVEVENE